MRERARLLVREETGSERERLKVYLVFFFYCVAMVSTFVCLKLPATVPATERQGETESEREPVREETVSERERLKFELGFFF